MATKFRTSIHSLDIDPVEVLEDNEPLSEGFTSDYIRLANGNTELQYGETWQYHDTHEKAKQHLIEKTEAEIEIHTRLLAAEKANLAKLQELKK